MVSRSASYQGIVGKRMHLFWVEGGSSGKGRIPFYPYNLLRDTTLHDFWKVWSLPCLLSGLKMKPAKRAGSWDRPVHAGT